eukprot:2421785-Rhodomonas_salina.1
MPRAESEPHCLVECATRAVSPERESVCGMGCQKPHIPALVPVTGGVQNCRELCDLRDPCGTVRTREHARIHRDGTKFGTKAPIKH